MGRPPEMAQGDVDVADYLHGARAELWRELRDQPLTLGGYCLLALQSGEVMGVGASRMRLQSHLPGPRAPEPGRPSECMNWTITLESPAEEILPFFLCLIPGLQSRSFYFLAA